MSASRSFFQRAGLDLPSSLARVGNLTRDEVLDNITMTWVTNTGISSGRLY